MKPETEKRMAERVKCYIRGGKLYLPDDNYFCQASPFEIALWQLCGELLEKGDNVVNNLDFLFAGWMPEELRAAILAWRPLPHPPEGE